MRNRLLALLIDALVLIATYWVSTIGLLIWLFVFSTTCNWCDGVIALVVPEPRPSLVPISPARTQIVFWCTCLALALAYKVFCYLGLRATLGDLALGAQGFRGRAGTVTVVLALLLAFAVLVRVWAAMFRLA